MGERTFSRVVVIDDHPVIAVGLPQLAQLEVIGAFSSVEGFLGHPQAAESAVVLLDLRLDDRVKPGEPEPLMGTAAIRRILDAGRGPIVIYTSIAEEMLIAACLAAGAMGAITKRAPGATVTEVVNVVASGNMWMDPAIAGALTMYAKRKHAGALSPQQANALRYRGQGLKQQAIADKIGVADPEIVNRYLKAAVQKLDYLDTEDSNANRHPGAVYDSLARQSGITRLVRWIDLQDAPRRHRKQ